MRVELCRNNLRFEWNEVEISLRLVDDLVMKSVSILLGNDVGVDGIKPKGAKKVTTRCKLKIREGNTVIVL